MIFVGVLFAAAVGTDGHSATSSRIPFCICGFISSACRRYDLQLRRSDSAGDRRYQTALYFDRGRRGQCDFNLFFVIVFNMGVAGVAVATVISQVISAVLILMCLLKMDGMCQLHKNKIRLHAGKVKEMLRIGIPAGLQGIVFSISNVLIQSSINSFGSSSWPATRPPATSKALSIRR
ncbi:MAG: hypothetical protein ACLSA6_05900 [Holdemania massiliensis]